MVLAAVRGGSQSGRSVGGGRPSKLERLIEVLGAVVDPGKDVRVKIDHGYDTKPLRGEKL